MNNSFLRPWLKSHTFPHFTSIVSFTHGRAKPLAATCVVGGGARQDILRPRRAAKVSVRSLIAIVSRGEILVDK